MASIIIRTAVIYVLLSITMKIIGKRQIGELDVSELVSTLLISEIVSIPIDDPDIPLLSAVISVLFVFSLEVIISTVKNRSEKLKRAIEGKPVYIIYKGRLNQKLLSENRISVDELLSEMRVQGITSIDEIYYGIVEQNGSLSLIKKGDSPMAHAIIIDGELIRQSLEREKISEKRLNLELSKRKLEIKDVFLMTVSDTGKIQVIEKDADGK